MNAGTSYFATVAAAILAAGCITNPREIGPVDARTVGCSLKIASRDSRGVPTHIRVIYSNRWDRDLTITLPAPLCGEGGSPPASLIGIRLTNPTNAEEAFVFVLPEAKVCPAAKTTRLKPGEGCVVTYGLDKFYRYGPCGSDRWGSFVKYFDRGETAITMRAIWTPDVRRRETNLVESNSQTFAGSCQEWLFKKNRGPTE